MTFRFLALAFLFCFPQLFMLQEAAVMNRYAVAAPLFTVLSWLILIMINKKSATKLTHETVNIIKTSMEVTVIALLFSSVVNIVMLACVIYMKVEWLAYTLVVASYVYMFFAMLFCFRHNMTCIRPMGSLKEDHTIGC